MKDNEGTLRPTLGRLYTAHPALSLTDSHVVYVMGKVRRQEKKALVLSIDMKKLKLQGVAMFDAERMLGIAFSYTYTQSWIPKYFNPDVNENLKRPGNFRVPYPHKLPDRISMTYNELYMQLSGDVQEQHDTGACKGSEQEDDSMNLDYSCIKKGHE
uniref:DUF1618 domain-containing protein n=1 Tax=Arundo donax TaxID=35708 RepID=A0A0A9HV26_ARUDO